LNGNNFNASIQSAGAGQIQAEREIALWGIRRASAALVSSSAARNAVKRKPRTFRPSKLSEPEPLGSDCLNDGSAKPFPKFSPEYLDEMAVHMEKGIRDLPVWKDLVARVGLKEARKILRHGMLINWITDGNPTN
jgi:hypothetical protein